MRFLPSIHFLLTLVMGIGILAADIQRNYNYLYFENGFPRTESGVRRGQTTFDQAARANPDLVIQTGYYSLRLDCATMQIEGYDALEGSDYLTALTEDVTEHTAATLMIRLFNGADTYLCTAGIVLDSTPRHYVRLVEAGQYVQRFYHSNLVFTSETTGEVKSGGLLEITAWPDHVTFKFDTSSVSGVDGGQISLTTPSGESLGAAAFNADVTLCIKPHEDISYSPLDAASYVLSAQSASGSDLNTSWDSSLGAIRIDYTAPWFNYASLSTEKDTVYEADLTLTNPTQETIQLPLAFNAVPPRAITGTTILLCDEEGRPLGIPVQLSKNWHNTISAPHSGTWLRAYTMLPLEPGVTKQVKLRVVHGYWADGTVGAVSHSSLSLIGWSQNVNWKWDEAALGAWGESMTFDPSQHAAGSVIADVRPNFTPPLPSTNSTQHNWTENSGGGDFLNYYNSDGTYVMGKRLKTCYRWLGPNLTEVLYSGVTADDKIRFTYTTRGMAGADYHRRSNAYRYEFLEDVTSPTRLCFYQMGADFYIGPTSSEYHIGNASGHLGTTTVVPGGNAYNDTPLLISDHWLAIDDTIALDGNTATANRGLYMSDITLNGQAMDAYIHPYGRTWGASKLLYDVASNSTTASYSAGDVIEGAVAFIMTPEGSADYWGADTEFANRLSSHTTAWQGVYDEVRYNHAAQVTAQSGTLLASYPIDVQVASQTSGTATLAEVTIASGGIGHIPVILRGVQLGTKLDLQISSDGASWSPLSGVTLDEHAYYQGYYNAEGTMDYVFSVPRPTTNLAASWHIRVNGTLGHYDAWLASYPALHYSAGHQTDSEQDGTPLLLEYMLNANPLTPDSAVLPEATISETAITLSFLRHLGSADDSTQVLQYSTDLATWTTLALTGTVAPEVTITSADGDYQLLTVELPISVLNTPQDKLFWRLSVDR